MNVRGLLCALAGFAGLLASGCAHDGAGLPRGGPPSETPGELSGESSLAQQVAADRPVLKIAHRGYSAKYPENSIRAYSAALREGFDGVEFDLRKSRDGKAVVMHDPSLERTTEAAGLVSDWLYKDLSAVRLRESPFQPLPASDESDRIPGLAQTLLVTRDASLIQIELKDPGLDAELAAALAQIAADDPTGSYYSRVRILSFVPDYLRQWTARMPQVRTVLLSVLLPEHALVSEFGGISLHAVGATLAQPILASVRSQGKEVFVWGLESDSDVRSALKFGIDGVVTNHLPLVLDLVLVRGGSFAMGSDASLDGGSDEGPVHEVRVGDFYISRMEITQALYTALMGSNPSEFSSLPDSAYRPVDSVSWDQAASFANALSRYEGLPPAYKQGSNPGYELVPGSAGYRLPSEAEWEYAARGGVSGRGLPYAGSFLVDEVAWYGGNSPDGTRRVGGKRPNELGIFDLSGNVLEWCDDWYAPYDPARAQAAPSPYNKVARGGAWGFELQFAGVSFRTPYAPDRAYPVLGIRLVRSRL